MASWCAAWSLVEAGRDVLMLERGPWVERGPHNWTAKGTLTRSPYFADGQLRVVDGGRRRGPVAFRLREAEARLSPGGGDPGGRRTRR